MQRLPQIGRTILVAWMISWFALYLEAYRYHHVALAHLTDVLWPGSGDVRPGVFVRSVVVTATAAPILWCVWRALTLAVRRDTSLRDDKAAQTKPSWATIAVVCGSALVVLGGLNQLIRHPAMVVDVTLRTGNGGFVVLGLGLSVAGLTGAHRERYRPRAERSAARES